MKLKLPFLIIALCLCCGASFGQSKAASAVSALSVSPASIDFPAKGGTGTIEITSTAKWTVESDSEWAIIAKEQVEGSGNAKVNFEVKENKTGLARKAIITVAESKTIRATVIVTQTGSDKAYLYTDPKELILPPEGGEKGFKIYSDVHWKIENIPNWAKIQDKSGKQDGSNDGEIGVEVSANHGLPRQATITISGTGGVTTQELTLKQEVMKIDFNATPNSLTFNAPGGQEKIYITTSNVAWTVVHDEKWLSVSPNQGSGAGEIVVTAQPNTVSSLRKDTITILGPDKTVLKTIPVLQYESKSYITVTPVTLDYDCNGGSKKFKITSNIAWRVSSNKDWATVEPNEGDGSKESEKEVVVTLKPNPDKTSREAIITVSTDVKGVEPVQVKALQTACSVNPELGTSLDTLYVGRPGIYSFTITSNTDWYISYNDKKDNWIESVSPQQGSSGTTKIDVQVAANETESDRKAVITITGNGVKEKEVIVFQPVDLGFVCQITNTGAKYYTFNAAIDAVQGNQTIKLLKNIDCVCKINTVAFYLDLNGKILNVYDSIPSFNGTLRSTIKPASDPTKGEFNVFGSPAILFEDNSSFEITNVTGEKTGIIASSGGGGVVYGNVTVNKGEFGIKVTNQNTQVFVNGNVIVNSDSQTAIGIIADDGATVTVDGTISLPAAGNYIKVGNVIKNQTDFEKVTTKPGYYTYTDGVSTVWVKIPQQPPLKSINVLEQQNICISGVGGVVNFLVNTSLIADGVYPVTINDIPADINITASNITIFNNAGKLSINVASSVPAANYFQSITFDGAPSNKFYIKVDEAVCQIVETGVLYTSLDSALSAIFDNEVATIRLLKDIEWKGCIHGVDRKIIFDLNGKTLYAANLDDRPTVLELYGNSEIRILNPANGEFNVFGIIPVKVYGNSICELTNVDAEKDTGISASGDGVNITVYGNITVKGEVVHGVNVYNNAKLTVKGNINVVGSVNSSVGVMVDAGGTVTVDGRIIVSQSVRYICVNNMNKTPSEFEAVTTKAGYLTYTEGVSTVWVKEETSGEALCQIDETVYADFDEALADADGNTITLLDDINYTGPFKFKSVNTIFSLNGKKLIVGEYTATDGSEVDVQGSGELNATDGVSADDSKITVTNVTGAKGIKAKGSRPSAASKFRASAGFSSQVKVLKDATVSGAGSTGAYADNGEIFILGNLTTTGIGSVGANAQNGGQITIEKTLTVPEGATYIIVGTTIKTEMDFEAVTTKAGYLTYTDGKNTVWVKQGSITGIEEVELQPLKAWIFNNNLNISGLRVGETFRVFNLSGQVVRQGTAQTETETVSVPVRGLYIVSAGERVIKVR